MKRIVKNRKGFTLVETLLVIAMLSLVTAAGAVGISNIMAERVMMVQAADAEILGSTAFQALANEVRFGQNIQVPSDGSYILLDSATYGPDTKILLKPHEDASPSADDDWTILAGTKQILSEHTYNGLEITELRFEPNKNDEDSSVTSITISLKIAGYRGQLWHTECTVTPLNGMASEITTS